MELLTYKMGVGYEKIIITDNTLTSEEIDNINVYLNGI